jgi:hypothetical protein
MTNSEFSNFFETFYLHEVKQSEQSEVRMSQSGLMAWHIVNTGLDFGLSTLKLYYF